MLGIMLALSLVTAPTVEPLSTADAKLHLKIDGAGEDAYVDALVKAARQLCEEYQQRRLITQTWDWKLDEWPTALCGGRRELSVPYPPLASVTSITYLDADGATQTWAAASYQVDSTSEPGRIQPAYNETWPTIRSSILHPITIRYVAGYGASAASVPATTIQGLRKLLSHWHVNREPMGSVPDEVLALWNFERLVWLA